LWDTDVYASGDGHDIELQWGEYRGFGELPGDGGRDLIDAGNGDEHDVGGDE
jgi:hypothetical protein